MAAQTQTAKITEPTIIMSFSYDSERLIKEGMITGKVEEFVVHSDAKVNQICKWDRDVVFVFKSAADATKGGVIVFDPVTNQIKRLIETLAVYSCATDQNFLVVGGYANGMLYIFKRAAEDYMHKVVEKKLFARYELAPGLPYGQVVCVALHVATDTVLALNSQKQVAITNLEGHVRCQLELSSKGNCITVDPVSLTAFVGCDNGSIAIIDIVNGTIKLTLQGHRRPVLGLTYCPQSRMLISGGLDHLVICSKIDATKLTRIWVRKCRRSPLAMCTYLDRVIVTVSNNNTVAIDALTNTTLRQYSKTQDCYGIVVVDSHSTVSVTPVAQAIASAPTPSVTPATPTMTASTASVITTTTVATPASIPVVSIPVSTETPTTPTMTTSTTTVTPSTGTLTASLAVTPHTASTVTQPTSNVTPSTPQSTQIVSSRPSDPNQWNENDVASWLASIGLAQFASTFRDGLVNGEMLRSMTNDELSIIGIVQPMIQKRILIEIQRLLGVTLVYSSAISTVASSSSSAPVSASAVPLTSTTTVPSHDLRDLSPKSTTAQGHAGTKHWTNEDEDLHLKVARHQDPQSSSAHASQSTHDDVTSWTVQDVKRWMTEKEIHPKIQNELVGYTGAEIAMLADEEIFDGLGLNKMQANRLKTVLAEIGIKVGGKYRSGVTVL